jgi:hypothetical protein
MHYIVAFIEALPGEILTAMANLGSLLVSAGENIATGLVHAIESIRL